MFTPGQMQRILRRELDTDILHVRWNRDVERFEVGRRLQSVPLASSNQIHWFHVVAGPEGEFQPLDKRVVQDMLRRDRRRMARTTYGDYLRSIRDAKEAREREYKDKTQYKAKYYRRAFAKWADENL